MRVFECREKAWLEEIDGVELADFWQRALAFTIDAALAVATLLLSLIPVAFAIWLFKLMQGRHESPSLHLEGEAGKIALELAAPVLYFGLTTWLWNGRTVGKRIVGIRVVSLVHRHMSLWHSIERALGYGAAALEFGFGFAQFFIHPYRRTVQDRIAETIVVKEKSLRRRLSHNNTEVAEHAHS
jgi:uncharacterized RDD family membrane protein YckC